MRTRSRIMSDLFAERAHIGLAQERKEHLTAQTPCQMHFEIRHLVETNVSAHSDFWRPIFILHVYMAKPLILGDYDYVRFFELRRSSSRSLIYPKRILSTGQDIGLDFNPSSYVII